VDDPALLEHAAERASAWRAKARVPTRSAAFTTDDAPADAVRLAAAHDVRLMLVDASVNAGGGGFPDAIATLFDSSPADVGALYGEPPSLGSTSKIYVPFGGSEHDWAALEISASLCVATGARLRMVGTRSDPARGRRDSSRLLADASMAVQKVIGIDTDPLLVDADDAALARAIKAADVVVTGVSQRWKQQGMGSVCMALLRAHGAVLLVHRGPRPSALAPRESRTRFSWSL
jgi:hypothetical protein